MISAIIPFRDWSTDRLETCVAYLRNLPSITEILLVDFGSAVPLDPLPGCRTVRVEAKRWCLSEANNIGIAEASQSVVLKIDADVQLLLDDQTLTDLAKRITSGAVSFTVLQPTDFQYEGGKRVRKRLRPEWGEGCGNLFSRTDVIEIGGFDTRYFDYGGEDNDLCQRLRRCGKCVEYHKSDQVLHERHPPSEARVRGQFTDAHKKSLLADASIFRSHPFRYSNYEGRDVFGPALTVAIATTDRPGRDAHLAHCLNGLVAQTFQDFEVRICENGSPKTQRLKLADLHRAFPTLDLHLHTLNEPSIPTARNLITDHARGFHIAVHDDDDYSLPTRFEEQLAFLATQKGAHGCHSSWIEFDEETGALTSYLGQIRDIHQLMRRPGKVTLHGTALYRRDVLKRIRYDESLTLSSDHHLHTRMLLAGLSIPHTGMFHYLRRLHKASVSAVGAPIQRDVSDRSNAAYKYFLGVPFLSAIRAEEEPNLWVGGFPTMRQIHSYLPPDFGAFRIDLDLEAALELGLDPVFSSAVDSGPHRHGRLTFTPAFQGYGHETRLVMRSDASLTSGEVMEHLGTLGGLRGIDVVTEASLATQSGFRTLDALQVEKGQRRVVSRRYDDMEAALRALPTSVLAYGLAHIEFFAVNDPAPGVHVLLGTFDNVTDLEYAMGVANPGPVQDFTAMSNKGKRGGFNGA